MQYQNTILDNIDQNVIRKNAMQYRERLEKNKKAVECVKKFREFLDSSEKVSLEDVRMVQICCLAEYFDWHNKQ